MSSMEICSYKASMLPVPSLPPHTPSLPHPCPTVDTEYLVAYMLECHCCMQQICFAWMSIGYISMRLLCVMS